MTDRRAKCAICRKSVLAQDMHQHKLEHSVEKKFQCDICQMKFGTKSLCTQHCHTHQPPRFECHLCGKRLTRSNYLRDHLISHERGTLQHGMRVKERKARSSSQLDTSLQANSDSSSSSSSPGPMTGINSSNSSPRSHSPTGCNSLKKSISILNSKPVQIPAFLNLEDSSQPSSASNVETQQKSADLPQNVSQLQQEAPRNEGSVHDTGLKEGSQAVGSKEAVHKSREEIEQAADISQRDTAMKEVCHADVFRNVALNHIHHPERQLQSETGGDKLSDDDTVCQYCNEEFSTLAEATEHFMRVHDFPCDDCSANFGSQEELTLHQRFCTKESDDKHNSMGSENANADNVHGSKRGVGTSSPSNKNEATEMEEEQPALNLLQEMEALTNSRVICAINDSQSRDQSPLPAFKSEEWKETLWNRVNKVKAQTPESARLKWQDIRLQYLSDYEALSHNQLRVIYYDYKRRMDKNSHDSRNEIKFNDKFSKFQKYENGDYEVGEDSDVDEESDDEEPVRKGRKLSDSSIEVLRELYESVQDKINEQGCKRIFWEQFAAENADTHFGHWTGAQMKSRYHSNKFRFVSHAKSRRVLKRERDPSPPAKHGRSRNPTPDWATTADEMERFFDDVVRSNHQNQSPFKKESTDWTFFHQNYGSKYPVRGDMAFVRTYYAKRFSAMKIKKLKAGKIQQNFLRTPKSNTNASNRKKSHQFDGLEPGGSGNDGQYVTMSGRQSKKPRNFKPSGGESDHEMEDVVDMDAHTQNNPPQNPAPTKTRSERYAQRSQPRPGLRISKGRKKNRCEGCDKAFGNKKGLGAHLRWCRPRQKQQRSSKSTVATMPSTNSISIPSSSKQSAHNSDSDTEDAQSASSSFKQETLRNPVSSHSSSDFKWRSSLLSSTEERDVQPENCQHGYEPSYVSISSLSSSSSEQMSGSPNVQFVSNRDSMASSSSASGSGNLVKLDSLNCEELCCVLARDVPGFTHEEIDIAFLSYNVTGKMYVDCKEPGQLLKYSEIASQELQDRLFRFGNHRAEVPLITAKDLAIFELTRNCLKPNQRFIPVKFSLSPRNMYQCLRYIDYPVPKKEMSELYQYFRNYENRHEIPRYKELDEHLTQFIIENLEYVYVWLKVFKQFCTWRNDQEVPWAYLGST